MGTMGQTMMMAPLAAVPLNEAYIVHGAENVKNMMHLAEETGGFVTYTDPRTKTTYQTRFE
jgi:hypothetical protein